MKEETSLNGLQSRSFPRERLERGLERETGERDWKERLERETGDRDWGERLETKTRERDQQDTRDEAMANGLTQNNEVARECQSARELERDRELARERQIVLDRATESQRGDMEVCRHIDDRITDRITD